MVEIVRLLDNLSSSRFARDVVKDVVSFKGFFTVLAKTMPQSGRRYIFLVKILKGLVEDTPVVTYCPTANFQGTLFLPLPICCLR